jgi:DNA-binding response OmpR family regulator
MDVELHLAATSVTAALEKHRGLALDLIVLDGGYRASSDLSTIEEALSGHDAPALLLITSAEGLLGLRLPSRLPHDFVLRSAPDIEYQVRLRQLLWPGEEAGNADFIRVGPLTLNLATYQVRVEGVALDLTYLEYALLSFLVTHPGRTYSREALLHRVWGFEYYGGLRTVDVHVRRVRAKLGPELAQHLETVRNVGYLWSM